MDISEKLFYGQWEVNQVKLEDVLVGWEMIILDEETDPVRISIDLDRNITFYTSEYEWLTIHADDLDRLIDIANSLDPNEQPN